MPAISQLKAVAGSSVASNMVRTWGKTLSQSRARCMPVQIRYRPSSMGFLGRYPAMATEVAPPRGSTPCVSTKHLLLSPNWIGHQPTKLQGGGSNPSKSAKFIAEWSSPVARLVHTQEVVGSNPTSATSYNLSVGKPGRSRLPRTQEIRWFKSNLVDTSA